MPYTVNFEGIKAVLNSVFLLLNQLPSQGKRIQSALIFSLQALSIFDDYNYLITILSLILSLWTEHFLTIILNKNTGHMTTIWI